MSNSEEKSRARQRIRVIGLVAGPLLALICLLMLPPRSKVRPTAV